MLCRQVKQLKERLKLHVQLGVFMILIAAVRRRSLHSLQRKCLTERMPALLPATVP